MAAYVWGNVWHLLLVDRMVGLDAKARDKANVGLTLGGKGDTLSKLRTARKIERVSGRSNYLRVK